MYRCAKATNSTDVIAIGMDENQGGNDYNGIGTWETFTFSIIPVVAEEVMQWVQANNYMDTLLKIIDGQVISKTLEELQ